MNLNAPIRSFAVRSGAVALLCVFTAFSLDAWGLRERLRETALDAILRAAPPLAAAPLTVIDIDSATLARHGAWPWSRSQMARLVEKIAAAGPSMIVIDMLFAGPDRLSPAAVARALAEETGRTDIAALAPTLPDGDAALAAALALRPAALGAVLENVATPDFVPVTPVLVEGPGRLANPWHAAGAAGPPPTLRTVAQGLGLVAIASDTDGVVRRVPLIAIAGDAVLPGLAVEAVRLHDGASALIVADGALLAGMHSAPLGADGRLRLRASAPETWLARTVPAYRLLDGVPVAEALDGRIALLGSSAVEVGALRRTAAADAAPTLQIQADAVTTLFSGAIPYRPDMLEAVENAGALALGVLALAAVLLAAPLVASALGGLLFLAWGSGAALLAHGTNLMLDPVGPPLVGAVALGVGLVAGFAETERRERHLRRRFEQHLAPAVVARIAATPGALKLGGEVREITALFTDVEGFTAMTERAAPDALVKALDRYFDTLTEIVFAHGGMCDKIVGDAVHAFFNMPLDLDDHAGKALACARAIRAASERLRTEPAFAALGFGRTRIGLETGRAIVGDVGGRRKLDYTAHGMAINTAARLEAANKDLGTSICVGPGTAARLPAGAVRPVAAIAVRGVSGTVQVYAPAEDPIPGLEPVRPN
ncbi:CHASE2 domain-containing protein [Xanthobacter autotrophicus]|uniref:CHASE2 domain-containing protein n=1 Tax=Xanthobacter autotrophicus TaxID=280 RepID=UPI0037279319